MRKEIEYTALIVEVASYRVATFLYLRFPVDVEFPEDTPYNLRLLWEDGNYSCDCNRRHMFHAYFHEYEPDVDVKCTEGKYLACIVHNGEVVYTEFPPALLGRMGLIYDYGY